MTQADDIQKQFEELQAKYSQLELHNNGGGYAVSGRLGFFADFNGIQIEDVFSIFFKIPNDFPNELPVVKEIGDRIPVDFHKNPGNTFCLATPTDAKVKFSQNRTLLGFIDLLVVPYLFSFSYKTKTGRMPFGERAHGGLGILEFYCEYFKVTNFDAGRKFLKLLAKGGYSRKKTCPCWSGRRLQNCHGQKFLAIMKTQSSEVFKMEYKKVNALGGIKNQKG